MNGRPSVLVLDGDQFSALAIVRSLGRRNIRVVVGSVASSIPAIAGYSKYAAELFYYTDPMISPDEFAGEISTFVSKNSFQLVIPVTENTVLPLAQHRKALEHCTRLAIADNDCLELAIDKDKTFAVARELGVPVPSSETVRTLEELLRIAPLQKYPVVVKPSQSMAAHQGDVRIKLNVQYAFSPNELLEKGKFVLRYTPVILQEYFKGDGVGIEVCANKGNCISAMQHKRLHELPLTGGASSLRKSVPINPLLLDYSKRLIKRLNWTGVAMLEFKLDDASGDCRLMEINGRFWGSLPLAVNAGADFPYDLYRMLVQDDCSPSSPARIGWINRKLRDDIYWYLIVLFRRDPSPLITWPRYTQILADLASVISGQHRFDSFAYDDPKPFVVDLARSFGWAFDLLVQSVYRQFLRARFRFQKQAGTVAKRLSRANSILFVCYGNINRSALAQRSLESTLGIKSRISIKSTGFHPRAHRPADPAMVQVAASHGIELSDWSSTIVDADSVLRADAIFVMEIEQFERLVETFPESRNKTYLLGCLVRDDRILPLEIADPFGKTPEVYSQCAIQILAATDAIANALRRVA